MTTPLVTVDESSNLEAVIRAMEVHGVRRIPVVRKSSNSHERCVGLVTLDDLIMSGNIDSRRLSRIVRAQLVRYVSIRAKLTQLNETRLADTSLVASIAELAKTQSDQAATVLRSVLSALVQCLPASSAAVLIAHLPDELHAELLTLSSARSAELAGVFSIKDMLDRVISDSGASEPEARRLVIATFAALTELLDENGLNDLKSDLPREYQALFVGPARPEAAHVSSARRAPDVSPDLL